MGALPVIDPRAPIGGPPAPPPFVRLTDDFAAFYRREMRSIVTLAAAIAGTSRAEEVAQEAMLRAHQEWDRIACYEKPGAWVRRVAINLATSNRRRQRSEARALQVVGNRTQVVATPPEVDGFWTLVRALPPRQAVAVALHYLDDLSIADIADVMDCAEGTAKAHLHKGRQTLAAQLRAQEIDR